MSSFLRVPVHRYEDPLARVWIACAERVGFRVARTADAFASSDGKGTLLIGEDALLDPDDNLAQMIFHELCHALVEGEEGEHRQDWGLDNTSGRDTWREHACLRLQAYLADSAGLRAFFAPTTDFRVKFWARLAADPFQSAQGPQERSCVAARLAAWRASQPRWKAPLDAALGASAAIASAVPGATMGDSASDRLPSLWTICGSPPAPHPAGHSYVIAYRSDFCATCAWSFDRRGSLRCRHSPDVRIPADSPACARWEAKGALDCQGCGACCREAYTSVEVSRRDPVVRKYPDLVLDRGSHLKLRRESDRCAALKADEEVAGRYRCVIYEDRPRTCRDFTAGSANCLDARRRVGLSL
jgi:hypothetical protein